jgi:O-antigen/teichoic acid export membrane protein
MKLGSTFLLSAVANMVRILSGLVTTKVMAVQLGPAGVALIGQFSNFHGLLCVLSTCVTSQGLIRLSAEHAVGSDSFAQTISTGLRITLAVAAGVGLVTLLFAYQLAALLLQSAEFWPYIALAGATVIFHSASIVILTILNGQQDSATYTRISIAQGLVASVFSISGALLAGLPGVFAGMALSIPFSLIIGTWMVRRKPWFRLSNLSHAYSPIIAKRFVNFGLMSVATAVSTPVALLFVRDMLIDATSLETAGHWQAVWRISEIYLGILVTTIGLYLLPKLGRARDKASYIAEMKRIFLLVLGLCACVSAVLLVGGHWVVRLLYSAAFDPMQALFPLQIAGDFFKALALAMNTVLIVRVRVGQQMFGELFFAGIFAFVSFILVKGAGTNGIQLAYLISQFFWAAYLLFCVRRAIQDMPEKTEAPA